MDSHVKHTPVMPSMSSKQDSSKTTQTVITKTVLEEGQSFKVTRTPKSCLTGLKHRTETTQTLKSCHTGLKHRTETTQTLKSCLTGLKHRTETTQTLKSCHTGLKHGTIFKTT